MYYAALNNMGAGFQVTIWRRINGVWTALVSKNVTSAAAGNLAFTTVGSTLKVFLNTVEVASANDTLLTSGSVGMASIGNVAIDNFVAN